MTFLDHAVATVATLAFVAGLLALVESVARAKGVFTWTNRNVLLARAAHRWRCIGP